jgi:hypothetical protein
MSFVARGSPCRDMLGRFTSVACPRQPLHSERNPNLKHVETTFGNPPLEYEVCQKMARFAFHWKGPGHVALMVEAAGVDLLFHRLTG